MLGLEMGGTTYIQLGDVCHRVMWLSSIFLLRKKLCQKKKFWKISGVYKFFLFAKKIWCFFWRGNGYIVFHCVSTCPFVGTRSQHRISSPSKTQGKVPEAVPKAKAKAKAQQTVPGFLVNMKMIEVCLEHLFLTRLLGAHDALRLQDCIVEIYPLASCRACTGVIHWPWYPALLDNLHVDSTFSVVKRA